MAVRATRDQGKSMFIKEFLVDNPEASHQEIVDAWRAAGMPGGISATLVSRVRTREGLSRKRKPGRRTAAATSGAARTPRATGNRAGRLMELEVEIDHVLKKVVALGSLDKVEHVLRQTRRQLYSAS